ncbi:hypothetical protein FRC07_011751, partial [Ceratobasidium sp. 392]
DSIEAKLLASRAVVNGTRNMSVAFVPINVLPPEMFGRIFSFAIASTFCYKRYGESDSLLAILAVCTRWRQIAIGTRSLWSHIDLVGPSRAVGDGSDRIETTQLWLERSRGAPLHIHIRLRDNVDHQHLAQLLASLKPHLAYLSSLVLPNAERSTVDVFLYFCSRYGVPGSLKSLVVSSYQDYKSEPQLIWPTTYLRGLVDLQLWGLPKCMSPTLEELAAVFSGSQALRTLRIRKMAILPRRQARVISLPQLQVLDIVDLEPSSLLGLLSMVSLAGNQLDFRFTLRGLSNHDVVNVLVPFCRQANVVSLCLVGGTGNLGVQVVSLLSSMPFMRVLVLDGDCSSLDALDSFIDATRENKIARCPKLHTLYLKCSNNMQEDARDRVEQFVENHSLGAIVLEGCDLGSYDGDPQYSDDEVLCEQKDAEFWECLPTKVKSVT